MQLRALTAFAYSQSRCLTNERLDSSWSGRQVAQPTDTLRLNPPAARRPGPAQRARAEGPKRDIPWLKAKKGRLPVLDTREYGGTS